MRRVILLTGPESSGTRWLAGALSQHPAVGGPRGEHDDPLDGFWNDDEPIGNGLWLTRRSLPHGKNGAAATYMGFEDLERLYRACDLITVLIATRSPQATLRSAMAERASIGGSVKRARSQYREAYKHIFAWVAAHDLPFWVVSMEAALLDQDAFFASVFQLLDLVPFAVETDYRIDVNRGRYQC